MSKNLGNIPRQYMMSEEQEQAYTNGINKGIKLAKKLLIEELEEYQEFFKSISGLDSETPPDNPEKTLGYALGIKKSIDIVKKPLFLK